MDHDTNNESELLRLAQLGLDVVQIQRNRRIGSQENTRSIGDYSVKGGYKDFDILRYGDPLALHDCELGVLSHRAKMVT